MEISIGATMTARFMFIGEGEDCYKAFSNGMESLYVNLRAEVAGIMAKNGLYRLPPPLFVHPEVYVNNMQNRYPPESKIYCIPNGKETFIFFN